MRPSYLEITSLRIVPTFSLEGQPLICWMTVPSDMKSVIHMLQRLDQTQYQTVIISIGLDATVLRNVINKMLNMM